MIALHANLRAYLSVGMKYLSKGIIGLVLIFLTLGLVVISLSIISSALKERSTQTNFRGGQERTIAVPIGKFEISKFSPEIISYGEVTSWNSLGFSMARHIAAPHIWPQHCSL